MGQRPCIANKPFVILSYVQNQMADLLKWFKHFVCEFGAEEYSAAAKFRPCSLICNKTLQRHKNTCKWKQNTTVFNFITILRSGMRYDTYQAIQNCFKNRFV